MRATGPPRDLARRRLPTPGGSACHAPHRQPGPTQRWRPCLQPPPGRATFPRTSMPRARRCSSLPNACASAPGRAAHPPAESAPRRRSHRVPARRPYHRRHVRPPLRPEHSNRRVPWRRHPGPSSPCLLSPRDRRRCVHRGRPRSRTRTPSNRVRSSACAAEQATRRRATSAGGAAGPFSRPGRPHRLPRRERRRGGGRGGGCGRSGASTTTSSPTRLPRHPPGRNGPRPPCRWRRPCC